jgi:uncharacterized protein YabN with tetrapyrrole methylase and pyrophosphatase domain
LLQVVFNAQVAKEAGDFDESDVSTAIVEKLVRRHPHISAMRSRKTPKRC